MPHHGENQRSSDERRARLLLTEQPALCDRRKHLGEDSCQSHLCLGALLCSWALALLASSKAEAQLVRFMQGGNAAAIQATVDAFRADLGAANANGPCTAPRTPGVGRRGSNRDGVPDNFRAPCVFPDDFLNPNSCSRRQAAFAAFSFRAPVRSARARTATRTPILIMIWVEICLKTWPPAMAYDFAAFSAQRIFGIVGSNEMDVTFSPGPVRRALPRS